jgi:hypothetical protein
MSKKSNVQSLFDLLSSAPVKGVAVERVLDKMSLSKGAVMCLISALRNDFGAEIETVRDGRQAKDYILKNPDVVAKNLAAVSASKPAKAPKAVKQPKVKTTVVRSAVKKSAVKASKSVPVADDGSVPVLDSDLEISEVSAAELQDIKSQLGLA